jgi:hypothetical protein
MEEQSLSINDGVYVHPIENSDIQPALPKHPSHLLITGLGRGGTTAIANVVQELGFDFGEPHPFMENQLLKGYLQAGHFEKLRDIFSNIQDNKRLAWKEPKLRSHQAAELIMSYPPNVGVVIVFRDILAISKRNNLIIKWSLMEAMEQSLKELKKLVTLASLLKNRHLILVSYEKLLIDTEGVVNIMADWLNVSDEERRKMAIEVISPSPESYRIACLDSIKTNQ